MTSDRHPQQRPVNEQVAVGSTLAASSDVAGPGRTLAATTPSGAARPGPAPSGLSVRGLRVVYQTPGRADLGRRTSRSRPENEPISRTARSARTGRTARTVRAVDGVDLDVAPGEVVALLGASGSGKSSLLRAVAGLEDVAGGTITWDGQDVVTVPVHRRGFGLMFQDGQLFAHRSVAGNVAYGLGPAGVPRAERAYVVEQMLELVDLSGYGSRPVTTLSGGQAQRVALARALAPRPRLLLLDEPLSALDRALREQLSVDLRRILGERGTTALYVTHDQDEAMTVADRVGVMADGHLLRLAPPARLWRDPGSEVVARFLGFGPVLDADAAAGLGLAGDGRLALAPGALTVVGADAGAAAGSGAGSGLHHRAPSAGTVTAPVEAGTVTAQVEAVRVRRGTTEVQVRLAGQHAVAVVPAGMRAPEPGATVRLVVDPARTACLDEAGEIDTGLVGAAEE